MFTLCTTHNCEKQRIAIATDDRLLMFIDELRSQALFHFVQINDACFNAFIHHEVRQYKRKKIRNTQKHITHTQTYIQSKIMERLRITCCHVA